MPRYLLPAILGLVALAGQARADIIYYSDSAGNIGTVNTVTLTATTIGSTGVGAMSDIAFAPNGTLYGVNLRGLGLLPSSLYTISPTTGQATIVGAVGGTGEAGLSALAVSPAGTIYAARPVGIALTTQLSTLNPTTAVGTNLGSPLTGHGQLLDTGDLVFVNGKLYVTDTAGDIDQVDPTTGALISSEPTGHTDIVGLAFTDGTLYGLTSVLSGNHLLEISPATGATVDLGPVSGLPALDSFTGATAVPAVPEPTTLLALGLGLAGLVARSRFRRKPTAA